MNQTHENPGNAPTATPDLKSKTFDYTELRAMVGSTLVKSGAIVQGNDKWRFSLDQEIDGFDENQAFMTFDQAVDAILPYLWNTYPTILKEAAA